MRTGLFIIPFIALFIGALGTVLANSYPDKSTIYYSASWGIAGLAIAAWIWLDREGLKAVISRKGSKYGASSGVTVFLGILTVIGLAVVTSRPRIDKSFDLSRDSTNTLSEQSIKTVDLLTKKSAEVSVVAFFQDQQQESQFRDLIGLYQKAGAKLKMEFSNPMKDSTKAMAEKLTNANTVIFRFGNQENRITTFTEEKITNALNNVLKDTVKKVLFTKGHGEGQLTGNEQTGFDISVQELKNNRFEVSDVNLLELSEAPKDAVAVVVAGPKYDFKEGEITHLENFVKGGGNLLVMVDAMVQAPNLFQFMKRYGIEFNNDFMILAPNDPRVQIIGQNMAIVSEFDDFSPVTKDFAKKSNVALLLANARSLSEVTENENKFKVTMLAKTPSDTGIRIKNVNSQADLRGLTQDRVDQGSFTAIASATGKAGEKEVRIIASGSVQFANNYGAQTTEHRDLLLNMVNYLAQDEDFIAIRPKDPTKSTINLTSGIAVLNLKFISFIYPFLFLGLGILYWTRRRTA